jgi:putative flippase GtrA
MREIQRRAVKDRRVRWFVVAGGFTVFGLGLLKLFVGVWHWPYAVSTLVQSETCNLLRFFVNDRWVFGRARPTWRRLWQYHVANALGFAVWWAGANALKAAGMNYLLASVFAMLGSAGVSILTNFCWIWRKRHHGHAAEGAK